MHQEPSDQEELQRQAALGEGRDRPKQQPNDEASLQRQRELEQWRRSEVARKRHGDELERRRNLEEMELRRREEEELRRGEEASLRAQAEAELRRKEEAENAQRRREKESRLHRKKQFKAKIDETRKRMKSSGVGGALDGRRMDRPGGAADDAALPEFDRSVHVPTLALVDPMAGIQAGRGVLEAAARQPYYEDRFFDIREVMRDQSRGGMLDVFRIELSGAKEDAKQQGFRPRIVLSGADGTESLALFAIFRALRADAEREDDGLKDTGNGFIWTDQELEELFPAIAPMWGQGRPGAGGGGTSSRGPRCRGALHRWMSHAIDPDAAVVNFDVWGVLPAPGADLCDFKVCELGTGPGRGPASKAVGSKQPMMKETARPPPLFVCRSFSAGFQAYVAARSGISRSNSRLRSELELARQATEQVPALLVKSAGVRVHCGGQEFSPPELTGRQGSAYWEVGFYNIDGQGRRCQDGQPACFGDGLLDAWWDAGPGLGPALCGGRPRGSRPPAQRQRDFCLSVDGGRGKGIFIQWDGESRVAFSPWCAPFAIHVRKALEIPVVVGPHAGEGLAGGGPAAFKFGGETAAERDQVRQRLFRHLHGELEGELNAAAAEIRQAELYVAADYEPTA